MRSKLKHAKKIVIKLGTNAIIDSNGNFNSSLIKRLAKQIHDLKKEGRQFIIVSSGAIGLGNKHLGWQKKSNIILKQCSASVGQNLLISSYSDCFKKHNLVISQLLLTHENIDNAKRKGRLKTLIRKLMNLGIIPIINENDSVSTKEITFGDNDLLSAYISNLIEADLLILLSDVSGLYKNMKKEDVIDIVEKIDSKTKKCISKNKSMLGKGGMNSKLIAAELAASSNTLTLIANSNEKEVIKRILNGDEVGTLFHLSKCN